MGERGNSSPPIPPSPHPPISPSFTPQHLKEPIEQLTPPGLEVAPNSPEPINNLQAIALQQELENLIGRFESAQLTADARNSQGTQPPGVPVTEVASTNTVSLRAALPSAAKAVTQAREIAKALPELINQQNYTAARQQWLTATQLLWNQYPTDRNVAAPEIRAMWLDRGTIVRAGSEQELAKIFDQLAAAGINTVFF